MDKLIGKMKKNSLFIKMFLIMCISIIVVSVAITFAMLQMSEKQFIKTYSMTNEKMMDQITTNIEKYGSFGVSVIHKAEESPVVKDYLRNSDAEILTTINDYYGIRDWVNAYYDFLLPYEGINIVFMGENDRFYSSNYVNWPISEELLKTHPITKNTLKDTERVHIQFFRGTETKISQIEPTVVISKALTDANHTYGLIYISIRERDFKSMYEKYVGLNSEMYLLEESGKILSSNRMDLSEEEQNDLLQSMIKAENGGHTELHLNDKKYLLFSQRLPYLDMYLVNLIDVKELKHSLVNKKVVFMISAAIVLVALLIVFLISNRFTQSHSKLIKEIARLGQQNFDGYVSESKNYEVNQISTTFNRMLDQLHHYIEQVMVMEKRKRTAELAALQYQISPHFLYNTLASIKILIRQQSPDQAIQMMDALIHLLQTTIGNVSETHRIEEEVIYLENYVYINHLRYGEAIRVRYLIHPDSLDCEIPKLFIQPFVENAFFHGFNVKKSGALQILVYLKNDQLICEVIDNGDGIAANPQEKRHHFTGIGIENVRERIRLRYGEEFGVEILSTLGEGTKVKMNFPIIKSK